MKTRYSSDTFCTSSGTSPPRTLEAALDYSRQGLRVVPLKPGEKKPWPTYCTPRYKQRVKPDETEIRSWYQKERDLNIGIHMGDGFIAFDVDEHDGKMSGSEALSALEAIHGPLPPTLTSITGTGGRHMLFWLPPGYSFGDKLPVVTAWLLETTGSAQGGVIDIKGTGLIAAPPSIHPNGNTYRWEDPNVPVATLPLSWCQTPTSLITVDDPERRTRRGKPAPRRKEPATPKELDALDMKARERLANVDPDALLGRPTLERLAECDPADDDPSHRMGRIIFGAAKVRFDPDKLYDRMLASPHAKDLRRHGRTWFDLEMLWAHRQHVQQTLDGSPELDTLRERSNDLPTLVRFTGRNGKKQAIYAENVREAWQFLLDTAVKQETTAPMVGSLMLSSATTMAPDTARKALQALEALGWCNPEDRSTGGRISAYCYHLELGEAEPTGKAKPTRCKRKRTDVDAWLTDLLSAKGPMRSGEVRAWAKGFGIPERTLKRHAHKLGVTFEHTPNGTTMWHL